MGGYFGHYLIVDLSKKSWKVEELSKDIMSNYLGGRGIGGKLLFDLQEGKINPLSPQNNLIVFSGPLAGTNAPGSSRITFVTKSPLSNTVNTTSMGGGSPTHLSGLDLMAW